MGNVGCRVLFGGLVLMLAGCKFSASASGDVNSGVDAKADLDVAPPPAKAAPTEGEAAKKAIVYKEGKLDYRGVINFEYNKAALRADSETTATLEAFREFLAKRGDVSIEIEGHTDSRGSDEYNRDLSDRRAASVRHWLIEQGIAEDRLTAVGKGEDEPQVPEPVECDDKRPSDTSPCEEAWAANRRVVFAVTGGAEKLEAENAPEPEPPPAPPPAPPPEPVAECPWLWGVHLNALGPNSWLIGAGAVQPGICWLEPSLGLGLGFGGLDANNPPPGTENDGSVVVINFPLRVRFWIADRHSPIADVGLEIGRYLISSELTDSAGETTEYGRDSTTFMGHLGLGYGYRPNGALAGPRLAIVVGLLIHASDLDDSSLINTPPAFNAAEGAVLQTQLDSESDDLTDPEPYAEVSFGWLW